MVCADPNNYKLVLESAELIVNTVQLSDASLRKITTRLQSGKSLDIPILGSDLLQFSTPSQQKENNTAQISIPGTPRRQKFERNLFPQHGSGAINCTSRRATGRATDVFRSSKCGIGFSKHCECPRGMHGRSIREERSMGERTNNSRVRPDLIRFLRSLPQHGTDRKSRAWTNPRDTVPV